MNRPLVRMMSYLLVLGMVVSAASLASGATDPHVGTWKLNVAKSKLSPGPAPQSQTVTVEADGANLMILPQGIAADGKPINPDGKKTNLTFDGKDYPEVVPNADYDTSSVKRPDANTLAFTRKKAGKIVQTVTVVVSKDGKSETVTIKGTNAKGEPVNDVLIFDKQ